MIYISEGDAPTAQFDVAIVRQGGRAGQVILPGDAELKEWLATPQNRRLLYSLYKASPIEVLLVETFEFDWMQQCNVGMLGINLRWFEQVIETRATWGRK